MPLDGEVADRLWNTVLEDGEVGLPEVGHRPALPVEDAHVDRHQGDASTEHRRLRVLVSREQRTQWHDQKATDRTRDASHGSGSRG